MAYKTGLTVLHCLIFLFLYTTTESGWVLCFCLVFMWLSVLPFLCFTSVHTGICIRVSSPCSDLCYISWIPLKFYVCICIGKSMSGILKPFMPSGLFYLNSLERSISWDVSQTGDQVPGLIPARSGNILQWRLFMMIFFYGHSLPSAGSRRAFVSFWQKNVHVLVNCLEDWPTWHGLNGLTGS